MARLSISRGEDDIGYRKGFLMLFNLLVTFVGIELISLGIYDISRGEIPRANYMLPGFLIFIGALVFLFSFHGHASIFVESKTQLKIYFVVLTALLITQAIALGMIIYSRAYVGDKVEDFWLSAYNDAPYKIRNIEDEYECCGLHTTIDHAFPKAKDDSCLTSPYFGYQIPCFNVLKRAVIRELDTMIIWLSVALAIQIVTAILTYNTYSNISRNDDSTPLLR